MLDQEVAEENLDNLKIQSLLESRKYLLFSAFFLTFSLHLNAQFLEFGGGVGATTYSGDLARGFNLKTAKPGVTVFSRMNMSQVVSIRYSLLVSSIAGNDNATPIDAFSTIRNQSFQSTFVDADVRFEYFFLDYLNDKSQIRWSPYFTLGIGFFRLFNSQISNGEFSKIQPSIPIGVGFKHLIGKRYSIGVETVLRKTFTDYLDNISETADLTQPKGSNPNFGNPNDKDWYLFTGFTFSYILYKIPCPFRYVPNSSILD